MQPIQPAPRDTPRAHFLTFDVNDRCAALHAEDVDEVAPMATLIADTGGTSILAGFLNLAGEAVPVLRLARLLELADHADTTAERHHVIVIVSHEGHRYGLIVTRLRQVIAAPQSQVTPLPPAAVTRSALRHDDVLYAIVNVGDLVLEQERHWLAHQRERQQRRLAELAQEAAA